MPFNPPKLPRVAVCLAAFNGVRFLQQQVDSIFNQTGVCLTLLVSVDKSTDGTEDWFKQMAEKENRLELLPVGEVFGGAAGNFFRMLREIDFSSYDYVAFADQDDIWLPIKLQRAVDRLRALGAAGYSSDFVAFWESGRTRPVKKSYPQRQWDFLFEAAGPGCTYVIDRTLVLDLQATLRSHRERCADIGLHDWFTYAFARANGYKWLIDDDANLLYRQHSQNQVGVNAGWEAFLWRARRVLSGWALNQARLTADLVGVGKHAFVREWRGGGRIALLALALRAPHCRRKPGDRVWFALSCLALSVIGWK